MYIGVDTLYIITRPPAKFQSPTFSFKATWTEVVGLCIRSYSYLRVSTHVADGRDGGGVVRRLLLWCGDVGAGVPFVVCGM